MHSDVGSQSSVRLLDIVSSFNSGSNHSFSSHSNYSSLQLILQSMFSQNSMSLHQSTFGFSIMNPSSLSEDILHHDNRTLSNAFSEASLRNMGRSIIPENLNVSILHLIYSFTTFASFSSRSNHSSDISRFYRQLMLVSEEELLQNQSSLNLMINSISFIQVQEQSNSISEDQLGSSCSALIPPLQFRSRSTLSQCSQSDINFSSNHSIQFIDHSYIAKHELMSHASCLSYAYKDTFVCIRQNKKEKTQKLVHFDANGKQLWEKQFKNKVGQFGMLNDREVIYLNAGENSIDIINLETHQFVQVKHNYRTGGTCYQTVETFADKNIFLVQEKQKKGKNKHKLTLTYYSYDNIKQSSKPLTKFQFQDTLLAAEYQSCKGNDHSRMLWWLKYQKEQFVFHYFDMQKQQKGKMHTIIVQNSFGSVYGLNNQDVRIRAIWETRSDHYLIVTSSSKNQLNCKNFVLEHSQDQKYYTLRQVNFKFLHLQGKQVINFKCYRFARRSIYLFLAYSFQRPWIFISYVDNQNQEIIKTQTKQASQNCSFSFFCSGWNPSIIVETCQVDRNSKEMKITVQKFLDLRDVNNSMRDDYNNDFLENIDRMILANQIT